MKLTFGIWCQPLTQHPLPRAWHQPNLFFPYTDTLNKKKSKNQEMTFYSRKFYPIALVYVQKNPRLEEADLGPSLDS